MGQFETKGFFGSRFFKDYGLVVACSTSGQPIRFVYMAGDPPESVRVACEAQKDHLETLIGVSRFGKMD